MENTLPAQMSEKIKKFAGFGNFGSMIDLCRANPELSDEIRAMYDAEKKECDARYEAAQLARKIAQKQEMKKIDAAMKSCGER